MDGETDADGQTDRHIDRQINGGMDREKDLWMDIQTAGW
jgi:hypothetical protein